MRIELNVIPYGNCARIFAFADDNEPGYYHQGTELTQVKIWHNEFQESLNRIQSKSQVYQNDCIIYFHSHLPFASFCQQFVNSTYNFPAHYHHLTHNCAFAANHALKIAGIDLQIGPIIMTSPNNSLSPYVRLPSPFLTPIDLFKKAKAYKIQQNQQRMQAFPLKHIALKLAADGLQDQKLSELSKQIAEQALEAGLTHPHQVEQYDALMNSCIKKISSKPVAQRPLDERWFQYRKETPSDPLYEKIVISIVFCIFSSVFFQSIPEIDENHSNADMQNYCGTLLLLFITYLAGDYYIKNNDYQKEDKIADTPLSDSIKAFNQQMYQRESAAKTHQVETPNLLAGAF